jgi:hypothetical protein
MNQQIKNEKILFLDHDGVICFGNNWGTRYDKQLGDDVRHYLFNQNHPIVRLRFDDFNKEAITALNSIIDKTGCEIVVTSDWRFHATIEEMGDYYESQGIIKRPIDFTPNIEDFAHNVDIPNSLNLIRIMEIKRWILDNGMPDKWCVVDDLDLTSEGIHFVQTYEFNGITDSLIKKEILKYLK